MVKIAGTIIEKILSAHSGREVKAGDVVWIDIDKRTARDFGGASVVHNLKKYYNPPFVNDRSKTFFTFDCNVPAKDIGYAENQQICRDFAKETGIRVFDVAAGIGSHVAIERGLVKPGEIFVGTDSHLNIMGAVGCFGQGMGDRDISYIWAQGQNWFEVPASMRVILEGTIEYPVTAKDIVLTVIQQLGSSGALGKVIEFSGKGARELSLAGRITLASMATEMGAVAAMIPLSSSIKNYIASRSGTELTEDISPDEEAQYGRTLKIDLGKVEPMAACPFSPSNVKKVSEIKGTRIDTAVLASCTNGRFEDMVHAASILKGKRIKEGVSLKVVPATNEVYLRMLKEGIIEIFIEAGALISNPGCGGCASGQIGMIGEGEIQLSTSNRNFAGKQGKGETYLVSPSTAAASVIAGEISSPVDLAPKLIDFIPDEEFTGYPDLSFISWRDESKVTDSSSPVLPKESAAGVDKGSFSGDVITGRARLITTPDGSLMDDIDTDMIFHNKYLSITEIDKMGQHTFETLEGYGDFASTVKSGDIIIAGSNFGSGSSRQQAVDCFISLGVSMVITQSTGAIYKRNIINSGFPFLEASGLKESGIEDGEQIEVDFSKGKITRSNGEVIQAASPPSVQLDIYRSGGLFGYLKGDD
ncbi:MAG: aconitase/3-isopropylmalate dehydratase large subunit family protein [Candidatus Krumholzibacteriota bacterium]|nr:aconitase/3-isopropylmalate dehydratase large subunit family protein [Candidatus Krumholzibacteriota bacterium]